MKPKKSQIESLICNCLYCINLLIKQFLFFKTENCKVTGVPGNVLYTPRSQYGRKGEKLTFFCRWRGQFLQGNKVIECRADGQWSDPFPTCGGKSMLSLPFARYLEKWRERMMTQLSAVSHNTLRSRRAWFAVFTLLACPTYSNYVHCFLVLQIS